VNRSIPLIFDEYVDKEFGTGALKITPAHDINDYHIGIKHKLPSINIFNDNGTLNESAEVLIGVDRFEARKQIIPLLEQSGSLVKMEDYTNKIGFSERTNEVIEPKLSLQWFCDMTEMAKPALDVVMNDTIRFFPEKFKNTYSHWMENVKDWCISRQLWWGHRIPVWYRKNERGETLEMRCQVENPGKGWEQDTDVLDTWFSSWLWPFATMGWPEKTATLAKFYPTTDLVTGPDIIFFWVARMIMAGYEFMGELPFRNVYFTGIIRDKQGRKMSKSLGNSPDPLELIAKFGADALRFGTMRSAPLGQDVLFDEKDVELGRNFCNKLWNACRFRQMQGGEVQAEIDPALLTRDDKWILLRLDRAIREITTAFDEYKFNEATQALYRFFWSEYCDWYVEASKAVLYGADQARKNNTIAVLDFLLSHMLRLFQPFLPFISEELWQGMGYAQDMPRQQGGRTIMFAPWPKALGDDFLAHFGLNEADAQFTEAKYDLVGQGRNLRREANIPSSKKVRYVFKPTAQVEAHDLEVLKLLLNAETFEVNPAYEPKKGTPVVTSALGSLYLPTEGLVDVSAEKARLAKELEKAQAEVAKVEQKLGNPQFALKVPPQVLAEHQKRLVEWQGKRDHIKQLIQNLEG